MRTLRATGVLGVLAGTPGASHLVKPLDSLQVPASVQAVLTARIDHLPSEEKPLRQTAAVIGTEVSLPLLQAIAELSEETLQRGPAHLQAAEFLYETQLFPEREYTFKHALTHEVDYGILLQERRRTLHADIVEALEALAGDQVAEQIERLAHHALRGEVWDKTLAYGRQAGEKAMARLAHREAVEYFEQALRALQSLPETREAREQAIDLRLALRSALTPLGDIRRGLACLREAEALAAALDDPRRLGRVSRFLTVDLSRHGAHDQAIAAAQRALALAAASGDVVLHALTNQSLGAAYEAQGDYCRAIECFEQTRAFLDGARRRERFGVLIFPAVYTPAFLARCHAELGSFAEGRTLGEEGLRMAAAVAHPRSLMFASWGIGLLSLRQGELHRALPLLERATGAAWSWPYRLALLAEAYGQVGQTEDGLMAVGEALTAVHQTGEGLYAAELYRLKGELLRARSDEHCPAAHACFQQALEIARRQQAKSLELRAAMSLSRLWQRQGQRTEARELLEPIYSWFTEGFDTADLQEAKALLDELS